MRLLVPVTVGVLLGAFPAPPPARAQAQPEILVLLDRYDSGEFDAVAAAFAELEDVEQARKDLEAHGRRWAETAGPADERRRRLVAATFALELANARRREAWRDVRSLVEWGCELVRQDPPSDAERVWQLASISLVQFRRDWDVLWSPTLRRFTSFAGARWRRDNHLSHALERFPDDVRLQFTGTLVDALIQTASWRREPVHTVDEAPRDQPDDDVPVLQALRAFADDPIIGDEARLRLGLVLALGPGRTAEAMPYLQAASGSDDVFIAYVAHYSAGRLLEAAGNVQQAQARYRAALAVAPGVQSASLSLSTLLFTAGQPDEAYEVMRQAFDGPPRPDPFRMYGFGNYRHFDGYVSRLRQALGS